MERRNSNGVITGRGGGGRQSDLLKSFKLAIRPLLTCCSYEDFTKAFSRFSDSEQQSLRHLFIQVITSLHKMIEEEFESLCTETQVGTTLDTMEQLVEEQSLDPLFSDKPTVLDVARNLSMAKEKEIHHLMDILETAEERNRLTEARIELLKKGRQDVSGTADTIEKLRRVIVDYGRQ